MPLASTESDLPMEAYPDDSCIHELFSRQAAATPERIALVDARADWTYAYLDQLTNRLARRLNDAGIGPEVTVGCYLHNPAEIVVHILSVLKAGGRYLLLDPQLPPARLRYMVTDARPALIVHDAPLPPKVTQTGTATLGAHQLGADAAHLSAAPLINATTPDTAAYVAYTSGSSGRPKGVVITHGATVAHARAFIDLFGLEPGDRVPLMAPAAFDVSTEEMIPPLLAGARLIASTSQHDDLGALTREIARRRYTILNLPAPLWQLWTEHLQDTGQAVPPGVRLLIAGSEKIHTSTLREWLRLPGARAVQWVAAYGVSESAVTSSFWCGAGTDELGDEPLVPIGGPIAGTRLYIVDTGGQLVADGTTGELLIGGLGLARGYLNLPELTRQKFAPDPFTSIPGARIYRTGDLARRRPDGAVVWVGRLDSQIKLRGLRIEPGEIEAILTEHPDVSTAVVALHPTPAGTTGREQLVAYVVPRAGRALNLGHLDQHVRARVPTLMVPAHYEVLTGIPLTATGKLDRRSLLGPGRRARHKQPTEP